MLRKFIMYAILIVVIVCSLYLAIIYNLTYSEGNRSGELIKFSNKGYVFKTWEGEISQGLSGNKIFAFSVLDSDAEIIQKLQDLQGKYVKVTYIERYKTLPWWGDTTYFTVEVQEEKSPFLNSK
jgi:hypothetical protein